MKYKSQSITGHKITLGKKGRLALLLITCTEKNSISTEEIALRDTDWKFLAVNTVTVLELIKTCQVSKYLL